MLPACMTKPVSYLCMRGSGVSDIQVPPQWSASLLHTLHSANAHCLHAPRQHPQQWVAACSGVKYPTMYATGDDQDSKTFNCIQRSHQNSSETIGPIMISAALLGLYHPITAASLNAAWAVGEIYLLLAQSQAACVSECCMPSRYRLDFCH